MATVAGCIIQGTNARFAERHRKPRRHRANRSLARSANCGARCLKGVSRLVISEVIIRVEQELVNGPVTTKILTNGIGHPLGIVASCHAGIGFAMKQLEQMHVQSQMQDELGKLGNGVLIGKN